MPRGILFEFVCLGLFRLSHSDKANDYGTQHHINGNFKNKVSANHTVNQIFTGRCKTCLRTPCGERFEKE